MVEPFSYSTRIGSSCRTTRLLLARGLLGELIRRLLHHLYHGLAWTYDAVATVVSLGRWVHMDRVCPPFPPGFPRTPRSDTARAPACGALRDGCIPSVRFRRITTDGPADRRRAADAGETRLRAHARVSASDCHSNKRASIPSWPPSHRVCFSGGTPWREVKRILRPGGQLSSCRSLGSPAGACSNVLPLDLRCDTRGFPPSRIAG